MPTGPKLFAEAEERRTEAVMADSHEDRMYDLMQALVAAVQANTAVHLMSVETRDDYAPCETEAWRDVITKPPLKECKGKEWRRPVCAERHTEDCQYADPPPEPKHVLLDVGTRVLVTEQETDREGWTRYRRPVTGRISGYDVHRSKYRWQQEYGIGDYATYEQWAFANNSVQVHPDGPVCPPPPQPVKREPTGPRVYVERSDGLQGHIVTAHASEDGAPWLGVYWFKPGRGETSVPADTVKIIPESHVDRCPHGQTRDECESGENQCELCLADEDDEGDEIEESMGLR